MKHVMIDIEALDKKPTAAIVSLAAAVFDPMTGRVDASMYRTVNIESSEAAGGTIGADTVKWWFKKSREVQAAVLSDQAVQLGVALADLNLFVLAYCDADSVRFGRVALTTICRSSATRCSLLVSGQYGISGTFGMFARLKKYL